MDSGGVGDFLRQLPVGFIVMFCGSGILLVFALGYIFNARAKRGRAALAGMSMAVDVPPPSSSGSGGDASFDLPDLDTLSSTDALTPAPRARAAGTFSVQLAEGESVEVVEVMTVLRDVGEGGLIIQIGEQAYRNPPALADAEFKRRFQNTLRDLNVAQRPVEAKPTPPPPASEPVVTQSEDDMPVMPPVSADVPLPGDLPKFTLPDTPVKPKRGQRPSSEPIPEINVAGSIETYLQHKLGRTPQFSARSIHVRPAQHGAVKIEVDGAFYDSVGEVEDESVRDFLTKTIEEWQARQ